MGELNINVGWTGNETLEERKEKVAQAFQQAVNFDPKVFFLKDYKLGGNQIYNLDVTNEEYSCKNDTIYAIAFEGMDFNGKNTMIFAYIGFPKNAEAKPTSPAIVLLHGGGGHANAAWVAKWTSEGYVAISLDEDGYFPNRVVTNGTVSFPFVCQMPSKLAYNNENEIIYYNSPTNLSGETIAGMAEINNYTKLTVTPRCNKNYRKVNNEIRVDCQWWYAGIGNAIIASNVLRKFECVDYNKIGTAGISYGSVLSTLLISFDNRFAFGIEAYGGMFMDKNYGRVSELKPEYGDNGNLTNENYVLWQAQDRMENFINTPVLWFGQIKDENFSPDITSNSYINAYRYNKKNRIALIPDFNHSEPDAYNRSESYEFAYSILTELCISHDIDKNIVYSNLYIKLNEIDFSQGFQQIIPKHINKQMEFINISHINNNFLNRVFVEFTIPNSAMYVHATLFYTDSDIDDLYSKNSEKNWIIGQTKCISDITEFIVPDEAKRYFISVSYEYPGIITDFISLSTKIFDNEHKHSGGFFAIEHLATCGKCGTKKEYCRVCGKELTINVEKEELHSWSDNTLLKPATVDSNGLIGKICSICGKVEITSSVIYNNNLDISDLDCLDKSDISFDPISQTIVLKTTDHVFKSIRVYKKMKNNKPDVYINTENTKFKYNYNKGKESYLLENSKNLSFTESTKIVVENCEYNLKAVFDFDAE